MSRRVTFFGLLGRRAAWFAGPVAAGAPEASPLILGFLAAGFLALADCDGAGFFFFLDARFGSSAAESSGSSSAVTSSSSSASSGDSFSPSSSSWSAARLRLAAGGASGANFSGTFVTRPERRAVELGAGELVAVLSEVSMRGCRVDGITFGLADGMWCCRWEGGWRGETWEDGTVGFAN